MDHMSSFQAPLPRVRNYCAFNFLEYDTTIPSIVEGRVHPIQFSNCITRINVAARTHRDKNMFLLVMFVLGIVVIAVYPIVDTTYYMYILLLFVPICILEFFIFNFMKHKTSKLLSQAVEQENEIFVTNGMRLIWHERSKQIFVEVVRRVSLSYENPILVQSVHEKRRSSDWRPLRSPKENENEPLLSTRGEMVDVLHPSVQIPIE